MRAGLGQGGRRPADAARGAGDDRDAVREGLVHGRSVGFGQHGEAARGRDREVGQLRGVG